MNSHANPSEKSDVPFPKELIGSRAVIQGASGAGKTYAIRRILETTHGRMQHIVFDVEDELFTLRERFDYVLIGGDGADAPLSEDTAGELAITLLELGVSAILQLNDFGLAGQRRVIARFLAGLMKAPRPLWHPVLITLDEAHRYAPQSAPVESSEAIVNLATAGRKRGFGALFATQRLSQLSKDVLGQCPNRIMGRVDQALDRRVAADTLGFSASSAEAQSLMQLSHEFWVVGPAFASQPRRMRFSPAVTTHLSAGHDNVPPPPTPQKLRALLGRLNRIAAESKPEAAQGKSSGFRNQVFTPDMETLRQAEIRGFERGRKEGEAAGRAAASALYAVEIARVAEALKRLEGFAQGVRARAHGGFRSPCHSRDFVPETPRRRQWCADSGRPCSDGGSHAAFEHGRHPLAGALHLEPTRRAQRTQGARGAFQLMPEVFGRQRLRHRTGRQDRTGRRRLRKARRFAQTEATDTRGDPGDVACRPALAGEGHPARGCCTARNGGNRRGRRPPWPGPARRALEWRRQHAARQ